ncbi:MAG TPA: HAD family hydrolase [Terriglobales bacterium]|jgi:sugar-phosphatase|nr:HAD family hydrolase [Terriglobales bacterium]
MVRIRCRGVLFDLDGVLIDSTPAVARCWKKWAARHGLNPEEVVKRAHGRPSIATIRELLPQADAERENRIVERAEIEDIEGVVPLPGARELLQTLPLDRWTIVTSCTRPLAEVRLRAAGLKIPAKMVTCSEVENGKPHPEPYLKGAAALGIAAADCAVVEDVPAGIRSGKAAGAKVIALRTTAAEEELREAGADWIVGNCGDLGVGGGPGELVIELM